MNKLQKQIAACFPNEYNAKAWKELIPQFITHQMDIYQQRIAEHQSELTSWQLSDQSTPAPTHPVLPAECVDACEEFAIVEGLTFRTMSACFYFAQHRLRQYHQKEQARAQVNMVDESKC